MKQIHYALRSLFRERGTLIIKLLSLTFGLLMGLLLLARVSFELSFDGHYHEVEHLMRVKSYITIGDERQPEPSNYLFSPTAAALMESFPQEIECATVISHRAAWDVFYDGNHRYDRIRSIYADGLFFKTMGIDVLTGSPEELNNVDCIFLSASLARRLYGEEDPLGKVLMMNKNYSLTVRGVFQDIPENSSLRHDLVISFPTIHRVIGQEIGGWMRDDSFNIYARLYGTDPAPVNARMEEMLMKYMPDNGKSGFGVEYYLQPITRDHTGEKEVGMMLLIMSFLAVVVLSIASLNYVLVSVSSLGQRAKAVGIHKCSGATDGQVLRMFMLETGVVILMSLLLVTLIVFNLRDFIEDTVYASLGALFTIRTTGILAGVVFMLFLLTGLLPGQMYAKIPVSQVFRRYTERKTRWKRPLLFVQFFGVAFVYALLMVVLLQYSHLLSRPLGYKPENVAVTYVSTIPDAEFLKAEIRRLPMVESVGLASMDLLCGWGGLPQKNADGKTLFTSRWNSFDKDYLPTMGIELKEGKNIDGDGQILINETYVRMMRMQDSPVGKPLPESGREGTVVGVMKDFPVVDWYNPLFPVMVQSHVRAYTEGHIAVRVRDLTSEALAVLNRKMEELYPQEEIIFTSLKKEIEDRYESARRFRDVVIMTSIVILLITFVGLVGYVRDEVRRRSKEIAIRKVNGAEANDILSLISMDLLWASSIAVLSGVVGAYFIGNFWLEQFYERMFLNPLYLVCVALLVLALILATVIIKAWRVANENPVKSIKSE